MFSRGNYTDFCVCKNLLGSLSDHSALCVTLPWSVTSVPNAIHHERTVYRWIEGTRLSDYSVSWRAWAEHTNSITFAVDFDAIVKQHAQDIDALSLAVE
jgi:hypothetical protein